MRVLVDTNVFLDAILTRPGFYQNAVDLLSYLAKNHHQVVVTPMAFRDIEYVIRKTVPDKAKRRQILNGVYSYVYKIVDLAPDDVINTLFEEYKDFEDGLIMETAERKMLDGIVTNNVDDFAESRVPVFEPKELVDLLKRNDTSA